jgi:hypothetical protein
VSEHGLSIIYGLAIGVAFIGIMGFAIDADQAVVLVVLLLIATALVGLASALKGYHANISSHRNR